MKHRDARALQKQKALRALKRSIFAAFFLSGLAGLMHGTLPVLARQLVDRVEETQRQVARLYALNSLGAVLGAGLAALLSHHRVSQDRFPELFGPGPLNRVRREQLEYLGPRSFFTGENSFFVESFDPLVQGDTRETDVLLDRFIKYRAAAGRPMTRREFADAFRYTNAMGGYGPKVAESITARARRHLEARPKTPSRLQIANEAQSALP